MPERIANLIVLAEDQAQQNLVRRFLGKQGHVRGVRFIPLPAGKGSGEQYVRTQFPLQLQAYRSALGKRASALLIVVIDADPQHSPASRKAQLSKAATGAAVPPPQASEPVLIFVPKRNVETWLKAILGGSVNETTDYSNPPATAHEIVKAAASLHAHVQAGASTAHPNNWPPSLIGSLPDWRRIP